MKRPSQILLVLLTLAILPTFTFGQNREQAARAELAAKQAAALAQEEAVAESVEPAPRDATEFEGPPPNTTEEATETTADPGAEDTTPDPQPDAEAVAPGTLRFHLMDGSILTGKLETDTLPIRTEFGDLVVPITSIESFAPGLVSHPTLDEKIQQLIQQLADPASAKRDRAQAQLIGFGPELAAELQRYANDNDAERKVRIATITEELLANQDDFMLDAGPKVSLARLDTIVTAQFTVAGNIQQTSFNIQSKFGKLVVTLGDIKSAQRITSDKPEIRRSLDVLGTDMAGARYKNSGIRINRGDRVIISAEGQITMTPWGNNSVSSPDGIPQNGMYNGKIPMGGLAGRIGDSGEEFLVGSKNSFVAQRSGTLYLGFAMQQNWANYQFPGKYEVRIRVVPAE